MRPGSRVLSDELCGLNATAFFEGEGLQGLALCRTVRVRSRTNEFQPKHKSRHPSWPCSPRESKVALRRGTRTGAWPSQFLHTGMRSGDAGPAGYCRAKNCLRHADPSLHIPPPSDHPMGSRLMRQQADLGSKSSESMRRRPDILIDAVQTRAGVTHGSEAHP